MGNKDHNNITLSKRDIAEKQLNTAIQLFFQNGDPVSTHTLTAASHDILEVLTRETRDFEITLDNSYVKPEMKEEFSVLVRKAQSFFKHASRDPLKSIEFSPFQTEVMLFDSVRMYMHLTGQKTPEVHVYQVWFIMRYPQYFNYQHNPNDPLFEMNTSLRGVGLDPERNLKAFGDSIPLLRRSGSFPVSLPKEHIPRMV